MTQQKYVYQFKISLNTLSPAIWRRIQVPGNYSFWDLHVAIQDAMGWLDSHLHQFTLLNPKTGEHTLIGIPYEPEYEGESPVFPDWQVKIADYCMRPRTKIKYEYDFGDDWRHEIKFEGE